MTVMINKKSRKMNEKNVLSNSQANMQRVSIGTQKTKNFETFQVKFVHRDVPVSRAIVMGALRHLQEHGPAPEMHVPHYLLWSHYLRLLLPKVSNLLVPIISLSQVEGCCLSHMSWSLSHSARGQENPCQCSQLCERSVWTGQGRLQDFELAGEPEEISSGAQNDVCEAA